MSSTALVRAEHASFVTAVSLEARLFRVLRWDSLSGSMLNWGFFLVVNMKGMSMLKCGLGCVGEFGYQHPFIPIILALVLEWSQELFNFLVDSFGLAISLWVVGCRCCNSDSK